MSFEHLHCHQHATDRCDDVDAGVVLLTVAAAIKPALWVLAFAVETPRRQMLMAYWVLSLALVIPLIHWVSAAHAMPTILVRKGYHLLALGLFLPALLWEPQLLAVSLAIALALLVVLEVMRLGEIPCIGAQHLLSLHYARQVASNAGS